MNRYDEAIPGPCPMCGTPASARHGSSTWGHGALCCSEACGVAYRDSTQRARAEVARIDRELDRLRAERLVWVRRTP